MHTFVTIGEAEDLEGLTEEMRAIDRAALTALAFHEPKRLKEEASRHRMRVQSLADRDGRWTRRALERGEEIIKRVPVIGGPK